MLTPLEGEFYVSGTFWLTVVIVLLTAGLVAMTVALITQGRRALKQQVDEQALREKEQERRSVTWETSSVPMLRNDTRLGGNLAVSWNGRLVRKPSIVTLTLRNTGNRDIPSDAFDGGRSVDAIFSNITALLEPEAPAKNGLLPVSLDGNAVHIGPGLFKKGEELNIVVLADGDIEATIADPPLNDVEVQQIETSKTEGRLIRISARQPNQNAAVGSPYRSTTNFYTSRGPSWSPSRLIPVLFGVLSTVLTLLLLVLVSSQLSQLAELMNMVARR